MRKIYRKASNKYSSFIVESKDVLNEYIRNFAVSDADYEQMKGFVSSIVGTMAMDTTFVGDDKFVGAIENHFLSSNILVENDGIIIKAEKLRYNPYPEVVNPFNDSSIHFMSKTQLKDILKDYVHLSTDGNLLIPGTYDLRDSNPFVLDSDSSGRQLEYYMGSVPLSGCKYLYLGEDYAELIYENADKLSFEVDGPNVNHTLYTFQSKTGEGGGWYGITYRAGEDALYLRWCTNGGDCSLGIGFKPSTGSWLSGEYAITQLDMIVS